MKRAPNGSAEKTRLISWPMDTEEEVKAAAHDEGLTVAEWVRQVVKRALRRRKPKQEAET